MFYMHFALIVSVFMLSICDQINQFNALIVQLLISLDCGFVSLAQKVKQLILQINWTSDKINFKRCFKKVNQKFVITVIDYSLNV